MPEQQAAEKLLALTFDDGPNTETTVEILDILEQHGAAASFFLIGRNITEETAPVVRRACAMGCEIGNHSETHSYLDAMPAAAVEAEVSAVSQKIRRITGAPPRFFRPPYIAVSETMFQSVGLPFIAGFGVDDYLESVTAQERYDGVMRQACDGALILLHDTAGNVQTVQAVRRLVPDLLAEGFTLVTVSELFRRSGVEPAPYTLYSHVRQPAGQRGAG
ncbi:MAG: polysaccharide deacetylase family protein [Oscillospiraceae bacterium]|nr:polysaccharide deacetylase family protein [Oscillospiraceae bacterium]